MSNLRLSATKLLLKCPICWDIFHDPVTLNCQHSYCLECIHKSFMGYCPMCNAEILQLPEKPNLIINDIKGLFLSEIEEIRKEEATKKIEEISKEIEMLEKEIDEDYSPNISKPRKKIKPVKK